MMLQPWKISSRQTFARLTFFCFSAASALAHAPFDCSTRVIVHENSVEIAVTVGATLSENFLKIAQVNAARLPGGHPFALNPKMATNFFAAGADGKTLSPRAADITTDGLEFQFRFEYALTPAKALRLEAFFLPGLKPPRTAPLVLTDEYGNLLGSAMLSPEKSAADFALPAKLFPAPANETVVTTAATNPPPEKITAATGPTKTSPTFGEFLRLGIEHILTGYDHLLFLTALLLGCRRLKTMLAVITGFTLAHSLTLALAALNVVSISSRIVEPAIAASIIFVAAENFRRTEKSWHRYALTCGFGLIHGFGFAGALRETGLATSGAELVKPLLAFNLGVETGQLCAAAVVLPLLFALLKWPWFVRRGPQLISALVMLVAAFWLWQRVANLE